MTIDTSTMLVIALLIFAASLMSYALSLSPAVRANRGLVVTGVSVGTALLLAAAVIAIVATNVLSLRLWKDTGSSDENATLTRVGNPFTRAAAPREPTANDASTMLNTTSQAQLDDGTPPSERYAGGTSHRDDETAARSAMSSLSARKPSRALPLDSNARVTSDLQTAYPWVATQCVLALQPDPAEPTRWWLENECGTPVAILFTACSGSAENCDRATSWKYLTKAMLLPSKSQRSVTYAEQTQHGENIRYVACAIWTASDECIARVDRWSEMGRRTGESIDTILGGRLPGLVHQAR